jgi:gliding motility-associated-like protein
MYPTASRRVNLFRYLKKYLYKVFLIIFLINGIICHQAFSQVTEPIRQNPARFVSYGDPFGSRVFVENKGQYRDINDKQVYYVLDNGLERIYFTASGLVYELRKVYPITERQREELEHGNENALKPDKVKYVNMSWPGSNENVSIEVSEKQSYYFTYGEKEFNSQCYKKLTYKNVYPNIDIEYTIPMNKPNGIKYSVILHPGANVNNINIAYSGDVDRIKLQENGEVLIKTPLDDLIEHPPISFYENKTLVASEFKIEQNIIKFNLPGGYEKDKTLIIDPWVASTSTLSTNNYAYDVDYDFFGNAFVYGGYNAYKVAMYNATGSLNWTFMGSVGSIGWSSNPIAGQASNFGINKIVSKTYIGQGYVSGGNRIIRLDALGNYDNFVNTSNGGFQEVWDMGFHCSTAEVFVLGGGTSSVTSAVTLNSVTASMTLTTFQPTISNIAQDVASHAIDDAGNIFILYAGISQVNNKVCLINSGFNGNVWTQPTGYGTFSEQGNKSGYSGMNSVLYSNGFNALAVNNNYLFYYDGSNLAAINKATGAVITSTTVPGMTVKVQGGIAVDDCNNLYLGGNGSIITYSYTGSAFTNSGTISLGVTSSSLQYVYDIKLDKQTKILYVCGSGFVGTYVPANTLACSTASSACLFSQGGINVNHSITCAAPGSATCTASGGTGPFTYTWLPSMQTGSVATGLVPGPYNILVHDIGGNNTYTAYTYIAPMVALTGTVPNPLILNCNGINNGTATVMNLAGGSATQNYTWTNGTTTQTTAIASGLGIGNYTVTVVDALTGCSLIQTFSVTQPPALTLNVVASTPSTCANNSITLTPLIGGGTSPYTYSWTTGPPTGIYVTTQPVGGNYIYTLTATDSKSCTVTNTILLNFFNTPTLNVNNPSICPGQIATITVSGANTYTWNNTVTGPSYTANPIANTIYTVVGTMIGPNATCSSTVAAIVLLKTVPVPALSLNSPICSGQTLMLNGAGGVSYLWNGPAGFISNAQQPQISSVSINQGGTYNLTVTAANGCTANTSGLLTVYQSPLISAIGSTVCNTQNVTLTGVVTNPMNSYVWQGPNSFFSNQQSTVIANPSVNTSGTYSFSVIDGNGCISKATAQVTVTPMPTPSFTTNSPQCDGSILIFNSGASIGAINYNWYGPTGYFSNSQNPSINNVPLSASGIYSLVVTAGPCTNNTTQTVTILPLPAFTITGKPSVCEGEMLSLLASGNSSLATYLWMGPAGFNSAAQGMIRNPVIPAHSGVYTISASDNNGCVSINTIQVNIFSNPAVTAADVTVCLHDPAVLIATGAFNYYWSGPGYIKYSAGNATLTSADNVAPTVYTVIGIAANSCTSTTTMVLHTLPLPKVTLSVVPKLSFCLNEEATFIGNGAYRYELRGPDNLYYEGKTITIKFYIPSLAGTYTLTGIDSLGCKISRDTNIILYNLPNGSLQGSKEGCAPLCVDLDFNPNSNSTLSKWLINSKTIYGKSIEDCFETEGQQTIKGIFHDTTTTCKNEVDFYVNVYPKPHADFSFSPETPIENEQVIFINTSESSEYSKFKWFFVNNHTTPVLGQTASYMFETEGIFPIAMIAYNKWGCADSIVKTIKVEPDFNVFVPNMFTPNDDDLNEVFIPVTRGVRTMHLQVFDRWGALLFETKQIGSGWNGTYRGQMCKNDIYTWKINVSGKNGEVKELRGHVTLSK